MDNRQSRTSDLLVLAPQNGENVGVVEERDPIRRHVRNGRDLATVAFTDTIYT